MSRAQRLLRLYEEMEVPQSRILIRIPATWEGLQAAKQLEAQGIACHAILVYRSVHLAYMHVGCNCLRLYNMISRVVETDVWWLGLQLCAGDGSCAGRDQRDPAQHRQA